MQQQKSKQFIPVKNLLRPGKQESKHKQVDSKVLNRNNLNRLSSFSKFDINGIIRLQLLEKKESQLMRTYVSKQFNREYTTNRNKKAGIDMIIPSFQAFNISSDALFGLNLGQQQRNSRPKTQKKSSRQLKRKSSVKEYINISSCQTQQKSTEKKRKSVYWKRQQKPLNNEPLFFKVIQRSGDELNKQSYHQIHNRKWEKITQRKFRSKNVQNIVRRKATHSFHDSMIQYCRRMKLDEQSRIFIFQSSDTWLKELLIEKGWVHNHDPDSKIFHFKWTYKTSSEKSDKNQLVNHFYESDELTSKQGLAKMVKRSPFLQLNSPRSYDLGAELTQFINDYNQTQILCGLKKIARLIQSKKQSQQTITPQFLYRSFDLIKNKQIFEQPNSLSKIILHIPFAIHLCAFCQNLRRQLQDEIPLKEIHLNENSIKNLLRLSLLEPPYDQIYKQYQQSSHGSKQCPKIVFNKDDINMYSSTISFQQASKELLELIYGYHCYFKDKKDTYRAEGQRNIWIVKNRNSSKGVGISLSNDLQAIQKKVQNRLAQKYLQNCSLFKTPQANFKYDLRVWVLVQSFCPLISYFYQQFYCRVCSAPYSLNNLNQLQSHITNYTTNKESYNWTNNKQNSILTYNNFLELFQEGNPKDFENLKKLINKKLSKLIKQTLVPYTTVIQSHPQCFQLFGFDILVSQQLEFYLIEVNLSPACTDRNQWLSENVRRMGKGLLGIVTQFWGPQKCEREGWIFVK